MKTLNKSIISIVVLFVLISCVTLHGQYKESAFYGTYSSSLPINRTDSIDVSTFYLNGTSTTATIGPFLAWPWFSLHFDVTVTTTLDIDSVAYYSCYSVNATSSKWIKQKMLRFKSNTNLNAVTTFSATGSYSALITSTDYPIEPYPWGKIVYYLGSGNSVSGNFTTVRKIGWNQGY